MIQHAVEAHAESARGNRSSGVSWDQAKTTTPDFGLLSIGLPPFIGTRYLETKWAKSWGIYRTYWAIQTAETLSKYPVASAQLRLWIAEKNVTQGQFVLQLFKAPPEIGADGTWWEEDPGRVAVFDDDEEPNVSWTIGELVDQVNSADTEAGAYVYFDIPVEKLVEDTTDHGGYTFFRLCSDNETDNPGYGATPELDGEDLGRFVAFDAPGDTHPPAIVFMLDLEAEELQQTPVDIEAVDRVTVTVSRRSNTQDSDGNFGTDTATTIASNVVIALEPIAGIASERGEKPTGFPEEATHLITPEVPIPMADHGEDPGVRTGDDVTLALENGTEIDFQILGINWLHGHHQEIHAKEMKARP